MNPTLKNINKRISALKQEIERLEGLKKGLKEFSVREKKGPKKKAK